MRAPPPRLAVSFGRMLILAQRRFARAQPAPATNPSTVVALTIQTI